MEPSTQLPAGATPADAVQSTSAPSIRQGEILQALLDKIQANGQSAPVAKQVPALTRSRQLSKLPNVAALPAEHRLAAGNGVTLSDLTGESYVD